MADIALPVKKDAYDSMKAIFTTTGDIKPGEVPIKTVTPTYMLNRYSSGLQMCYEPDGKTIQFSRFLESKDRPGAFDQYPVIPGCKRIDLRFLTDENRYRYDAAVPFKNLTLGETAAIKDKQEGLTKALIRTQCQDINSFSRLIFTPGKLDSIKPSPTL